MSKTDLRCSMQDSTHTGPRLSHILELNYDTLLHCIVIVCTECDNVCATCVSRVKPSMSLLILMHLVESIG